LFRGEPVVHLFIWYSLAAASKERLATLIRGRYGKKYLQENLLSPSQTSFADALYPCLLWFLGLLELLMFYLFKRYGRPVFF